MTRALRLASVIALTFLVAGALAPARSAASDAKAVIVVLRSDADSDAVATEHAAKHGATVSHVYKFALKGYAAHVGKDRLAQLAADPRVAFISEDRTVQALGDGKPVKNPKPGGGSGSTTTQPPQSLPTGVDRIDGERSTRFAFDNSAINVAIIDTGIDTSHPDLRVIGGTNCSSGTSFKDGNGHGTHVAGTVGAVNNTIGVVGVLPGASLWAVRVLNNAGFGTFASVICGVDFVTANANVIKVANMSLGGGGSDDGNCGRTNNDALHTAICNSVVAGVTYVVAAGNSGVDFAGQVPAAYHEVLTVTAIADYNGQPGGGAPATCADWGPDDTPAIFSNFAVTAADQAHTIAGPGVCILSTWKGQTYNTISGTSMATPHVTGTAALCIASGACTGLTPSQIAQKLRSDAANKATVDPVYTYTGDHALYGPLVFAGGY